MSDESPERSTRAEELLQLWGRGMEFTREILRENERLGRRIAEIEEENHRLASLYVTSYQLHSTLEIEEVLRIVVELLINLIGADAFAIYLLDEGRQELRAVAAEGICLEDLPACRVGEGPLGRAVAERSVRISEDAEPGPRDPERPLVCIPLQVDGKAIGAIALFGLLQQKRGFSALDRELFDVLAGHAATAILAARLYSQSERKLSTIQGFIDLLAR